MSGVTRRGRGWSSVLGVLFSLALLVRAAGAQAEEVTGRVVGVADGDTIMVRPNGGGREVRLRLQGIDAPEKGQSYGQRAKQFTSSLAMDRTVTIQARGRDRYGRMLAEVILPDGRDLNHELVRAGYAWWYRRYSRDPILGRLEAEAREAHRGLWADAHPIPPWLFRQRHGIARVGP